MPKHRHEAALEEWQNENIPSARFISILTDLLVHRIRETFTVFWLLLHFLASWWYILLITLQRKLLSQLPRIGHILPETLGLSYTTEALLISIQKPLTGLKNWESSYDPEQIVKSNQRILGQRAKSCGQSWKQLVFLSTETCFCSQHKCKIHNRKNTLRDSTWNKASKSNILETRTLPQ